MRTGHEDVFGEHIRCPTLAEPHDGVNTQGALPSMDRLKCGLEGALRSHHIDAVILHTFLRMSTLHSNVLADTGTFRFGRFLVVGLPFPAPRIRVHFMHHMSTLFPEVAAVCR